MEVISGLNNKCSISDNNTKAISKYLDKIMDIYNSDGQIHFDIKEKINVKEKIEPQARMFDTKTKKKTIRS